METDSTLQIRPGPDGNVVQYHGKRLSAARAREGMGRRLRRQHDTQTAYIFFSPLQGYGVHAFTAGLPVDSACFFLELERGLSPVYREPDCEIPETSLFFSDGVSRFREIVRISARKQGIRKLVFFRLSAGSTIHRDAYARLEEQLYQDIQDVWQNRATEIALGRRWLGNLFGNLAVEGRSAFLLPTGRHGLRETMILLGAGPSLDAVLPQLIDWTARHPDTGIAAIDTALPVLAEYNLRPDLIFTMDAQLANALDLMPWRWDNTSIVADLTCHPGIVRNTAPSNRYFFLSDFAPVQMVANLTSAGIAGVPALGSVAGAAIRILSRNAARTGFPRRVILAGLDFSFPPGKTHARMAPAHRRRLSDHNRTMALGTFPLEIRHQSVSGTDRNGSPLSVDPVLLRQALLVHEQVVSPENAGGVEWYSIGNGLDIGAKNLPSAYDIPETGSPMPGISTNTTPSADLQNYAPVVARLAADLTESEHALAAGTDDPASVVPGYLWELVTLDFPDLGRVNTDPDVRKAQSARILLSLRDLRRRAHRALRAGNVSV